MITRDARRCRNMCGAPEHLTSCQCSLWRRYLSQAGVSVAHVPDVAAAAAGAMNSVQASASGVRQSTNEVLMVAPTAFGFNDQVRASLLLSPTAAEVGGGVLLRTQEVLRSMTWALVDDVIY